MRERRVGQAAEIDHVGAARGEVAARARIASGVSAEASTISAKIRMSWRVRSSSPSGAAEKGRQVLELVGPALDGHAEMPRTGPEIGAAAARQHDAVGPDRHLHAPAR